MRYTCKHVSGDENREFGCCNSLPLWPVLDSLDGFSCCCTAGMWHLVDEGVVLLLQVTAGRPALYDAHQKLLQRRPQSLVRPLDETLGRPAKYTIQSRSIHNALRRKDLITSAKPETCASEHAANV